MRVLENRFQVWLVTTDHLTDRIWFRDDEDFKVGMNLVAVLACFFPVEVLAFTLMSNHVHFVLAGSCEQVKRFINEFKRRYAQHMRRKYDVKEFLRENDVDIRPLDGMEESQEWGIAYVQMNCVAANICLSPADYRWGTGNAFFRATPSRGRRLDTFSGRARKRLLHSEQELPPHLIVGEDGYILPESYVQVERVEALFRTPKRMNYFLQNSSKAKKRLASQDSEAPSFRDQVLLSAIPDLCQSYFKKRSPVELSEEEMSELLKQLRFRFSSNVDQLARVVGLSYEKVVALLDAF
ncbi:MAG: transposase [Clostridia bacterium]|nr:transposase [Clostridia bacterium]